MRCVRGNPDPTKSTSANAIVGIHQHHRQSSEKATLGRLYIRASMLENQNGSRWPFPWWPTRNLTHHDQVDASDFRGDPTTAKRFQHIGRLIWTCQHHRRSLQPLNVLQDPSAQHLSCHRVFHASLIGSGLDICARCNSLRLPEGATAVQHCVADIPTITIGHEQPTSFCLTLPRITIPMYKRWASSSFEES